MDPFSFGKKNSESKREKMDEKESVDKKGDDENLKQLELELIQLKNRCLENEKEEEKRERRRRRKRKRT